MTIPVVPLTEPLRASQADENGTISGVIRVGLNEAVDNDLERFLDLIGSRLVEGGEMLSDTTYTVVGHAGNDLFLEVSGDASLILECEAGEAILYDDEGNDNDDEDGSEEGRTDTPR